MGIGLSHPVSSKVLYRHGNNNYRVGAATMHGWRETMEDAHSIILSLTDHPDTAFFGIFDGHSGALCSKYVSENLVKKLNSLKDLTDLEAIRNAVLQTDEDFLNSEEFKDKEDGSAGIFTLVNHNADLYKLVNANIGDSRIILAKKEGDKYKAIACTDDHKPTNREERERIENAGGHVSLSRVDGQLALSRAFGDRTLKKPLDVDLRKRKVTSDPDFDTQDANKDDFLFLACDGIFEGDIFTRESLIDFISDKLAETKQDFASADLAKVCAQVLDECLKRGSRDNMSCMIVQFIDGSSFNHKNEYIPGPYFLDDGDSKFRDAYQKDAEAAGYSLEEAQKLRKQHEQAASQTSSQEGVEKNES